MCQGRGKDEEGHVYETYAERKRERGEEKRNHNRGLTQIRLALEHSVEHKGTLASSQWHPATNFGCLSQTQVHNAKIQKGLQF